MSFDRVPPAFRPILEEARAVLAAKTTAEFPFPRFLCGVSPNFVGLHAWVDTGEWYGEPLLYDEHGHCVHSHNLEHRPRDDRQTTIVLPTSWLALPKRKAVRGVLHELGHVLDASREWSLYVPETTPYSETNDFEAFAEAFEILLEPPSADWADFIAHPEFDPLRELVGFRDA